MGRSESEGLLATLVAFDTTSRLSNLPMMHFIRAYLQSHGVASELVSGDGQKANLLATIGPDDRPGFVLSGHTDVVPADAQQWTSDPFCLVERGDRLVGRGCTDMKGFIASVLAAVPRFTQAGLTTPIHLAFSYDEEVGCLGVRELLEVVARLPTRPAMGLVGEPTSMRVVVGHKGKRAFRLCVHGREGHSSDPASGVNAVQYAARIIAFIDALNEQQRRHGPFEEGYDVPHSTLHVGSVHGGTSLNVVPSVCMIEFEIRNIPIESPERLISLIVSFINSEIEPAMRRVDRTAGVDWEQTVAYPGLSTSIDAPVTAFVQSLLDDSDAPARVAFGTEAGLFHERCGLPMVICGPGTMADAHRPDESLGRGQLAMCDRLLERLSAALSR